MAPVNREGAKTPPELPEPKVKEVASGFKKISINNKPKETSPCRTVAIKSNPEPYTWGTLSSSGNPNRESPGKTVIILEI